MTNAQLTERLAALEKEVAKLKATIGSKKNGLPWWEKIWGMFADDPTFAEAVQYGRDYRESLRPGRRKKAKKQPAKK